MLARRRGNVVASRALFNPRKRYPLTRTTTFAFAALLALAPFARAQDPPPSPTPAPAPDPSPVPPGPPPTIDELDRRVRALEADLAAARAHDDDGDDHDDWCDDCDRDDDDVQFQLRAGWFNLQHNHHDEIRKNDGHQNGWSFGAGLVLRLWDFNENDYRYTWFGVADQDDEDYGQLSTYIAFNF